AFSVSITVAKENDGRTCGSCLNQQGDRRAVASLNPARKRLAKGKPMALKPSHFRISMRRMYVGCGMAESQRACLPPWWAIQASARRPFSAQLRLAPPEDNWLVTVQASPSPSVFARLKIHPLTP